MKIASLGLTVRHRGFTKKEPRMWPSLPSQDSIVSESAKKAFLLYRIVRKSSTGTIKVI